MAAGAELVGDEIKRLPEGAAWRGGGGGATRPAGRGGPDGTGRSPITEKEWGVERKTNLPLPSYVWVWGETVKWPNVAEGEMVATFLCLFGISDPPQRKNYFLLRLCFVDEASGEYPRREV